MQCKRAAEDSDRNSRITSAVSNRTNILVPETEQHRYPQISNRTNFPGVCPHPHPSIRTCRDHTIIGSPFIGIFFRVFGMCSHLVAFDLYGHYHPSLVSLTVTNSRTLGTGTGTGSRTSESTGTVMIGSLSVSGRLTRLLRLTSAYFDYLVIYLVLTSPLLLTSAYFVYFGLSLRNRSSE